MRFSQALSAASKSVKTGLNTVGRLISSGLVGWRDGVRTAYRFWGADEAFAWEELDGYDPSLFRQFLNFISFTWFVGSLVALLAHNSRAGAETYKGCVNYLRVQKRFVSHIWLESDEVGFWTYLASVPGFILGGLVGAISAITRASAWSAFYMIGGLTNLIMADQFKPFIKDSLKPIARYGIGAPGLVIGFVLGLVPVVLIGCLRVLVNSWQSFARVVGVPGVLMRRLMRRLMVGQAEKPLADLHAHITANRTFHDSYGFGFPGLVLGLAIGAVGAAYLYVYGSFKWFATAFALALTGLHDAVATEGATIGFNPPVTLAQRYFLGLLGTLFGTAFGLVDMACVIVVRLLSNSLRLAWGLSIGFINMALDYNIAKGLKPGSYHYGFAWPGVLLALPAVAFAAVCTIGKLLVLGLLTAIVMPLRLLKETVKTLTGNLRFSECPQDDDEKRLLVLTRQLDASGHLPDAFSVNIQQEAQAITAENHTPYITFGFFKSLGKFLRKSATADELTPEEAFLKQVHDAKKTQGTYQLDSIKTGVEKRIIDEGSTPEEINYQRSRLTLCARRTAEILRGSAPSEGASKPEPSLATTLRYHFFEAPMDKKEMLTGLSAGA